MKRYNGIDFLRGFCMIWIVWYHTDHPRFVDYPFFNATLFFVSGVLFKEYPWKQFIRKKFNQLIVPFCFFYIIYYFFLIAINYVKYQYISSEILYSISGVLGLYTYNEAFIVNYPLWFILALIIIQIVSNSLLKTIRSRHLLFALSIVISYIGFYYMQSIPTPFMIGRSLPYLVYFIAGFSYGKLMLDRPWNVYRLLEIVFIWSVIFFLQVVVFDRGYLLINFGEILSFSFILLGISMIVSKYKIATPFIFFGINSIVLFGMHDMLLTILRIGFNSVVGEMNIVLGIISVILTLLITWPLTLFYNKYIPFLVGKKEIIK